MSCEKHLDYVKGFDGSLEDLVAAIGNMRYDEVVKFFDLLETEFYRQADGDKKRKRVKLSSYLNSVALHLGLAKIDMEAAWEICEPYMKHGSKAK